MNFHRTLEKKLKRTLLQMVHAQKDTTIAEIGVEVDLDEIVAPFVGPCIMRFMTAACPAHIPSPSTVVDF